MFKKLSTTIAITIAMTPFMASANSDVVAPTLKSYETKIGTLEFSNNYPTDETQKILSDNRKYQRAVQSYIWALPIVSMADFHYTFKKSLGLEYGDMIRLNTPEDLKYGITANATTDYLLSPIDLSMGAWVMEVPEGHTAGFVDNMWQQPVMDLGVPGINQGRGGKHLIIPPNGKAPENTEGYNVVYSNTNNALMILRILETDSEKNQQILNEVNMYKYSERDNIKKQVIVNPAGRYWSTSQPRGLEYWKRLKWIIDQEPMHERDGFMYAFLKDIGIEKGKEFNPNTEMIKMLEEATLVGESMTKDIDWTSKLDAGFYVEGSTWQNAIAVNLAQKEDTHYQMDERAAWFYEALTTSKGMKSDIPGIGSAYLASYKDSTGQWLDGSMNYKLTVPANVPAKNFWSVTVYDNNTRYLIQNENNIADKSSRMDLDKNEDGSYDIYFGSKAPKGHEKNWIPTIEGEGWFTYFRLYGPEEEHLNKTWILPNIEKLK